VGGIIMVVLIALLFRFTLTPKLVEMARGHAEKGLAGRMEGHATMDMSVSEKVVAELRPQVAVEAAHRLFLRRSKHLAKEYS
jgi:hypothetical protein